MSRFAPLLLVLAISNPTPAPVPAPDATIGQRGVVNISAQTFGGYKTFANELAATGIDAGLVMARTGVNAPIYDSPSTTGAFYRSHLAGASASYDHYFFSENSRSNGYLMGITNQFASPALQLGYQGDLQIGGAFTLYGTITQTKSGATTIYCSAFGYCSISSSLPGDSTSGAFYDGHHGVLTVVNDHEMRGGWLIQASKSLPGNPTTSNGFVVEWSGAISDSFAQYQENQFPHCGGGEILNPDGGFIGILDGGYGNTSESGLLWAIDMHRWCFCRPDMMDGGAPGTTGDGWRRVEDGEPCSTSNPQPTMLPPVLVNTQLTVATLGGTVMPAFDSTLTAVHFYVGSAGSGGTTNVNIRASDGVGNCDFTVSCNTGTGPKRAAGSGSGCTGAASRTLTWSVTSLGNCTNAMTITGNLTPEAYWQ